jgi:hypothetical protein
MSDAEKFDLLMQEVGPCDHGVDQVLRLGEAAFAVRFSDVDIEVHFDPTTGRVMLSADIGAPPPELRLPMYEAVLLYSMLWRDTGGVRVTMSESGGPLTQMVDLNCATLTTQLLATVLRNFNDRTLIWRKYIEGTPDAPPPDLSEPTLIRV